MFYKAKDIFSFAMSKYHEPKILLKAKISSWTKILLKAKISSWTKILLKAKKKFWMCLQNIALYLFEEYNNAFWSTDGYHFLGTACILYMLYVLKEVCWSCWLKVMAGTHEPWVFGERGRAKNWGLWVISQKRPRKQGPLGCRSSSFCS